MKIRFLVDRSVMAQGEVVRTFKAGEVYELSASSARRWLRRNLAEEVTGSAKKPAKPKSAKSEEQSAPAKEDRKVFSRRPPITATEKPVEADTKETSK